MKVAATSDTHGMLTPDLVPDCDVLILAGDTSPNWHYHQNGHNLRDAVRQLEWLESSFIPMLAQVNAEQILLTAGNHCWMYFEPETKAKARKLLQNAHITYLEDEAWEYKGVKFYGSPWTVWFHDWAFNLPENDHWNGYRAAKATWDKIPKDTNVLVTHGPPFGILDKTLEGQHVGDKILRDRIAEIGTINLWTGGHIHEGFGQITLRGTTYANVSLVSRHMNPGNPVQTFEI